MTRSHDLTLRSRLWLGGLAVLTAPHARAYCYQGGACFTDVSAEKLITEQTITQALTIESVVFTD